MKWFRHFNNADESSKLSTIIDKLGIEGYGKYWLFTELMARHWDEESEGITINVATISRQLRHFKHRSTIQFLEMLRDIGMILFTFSSDKDETIVTILFPILRELQDKDSKYNRKKRKSESQVASLDRDRDREEDIDRDRERESNSQSQILDLVIPEFKNTSIAAALARVPIDTQREWLKAYGINLVLDEINKLVDEAKTNPAQLNKILSIQRMGAWLSRGKEYQLRKLKTKSPDASISPKKFINTYAGVS